jgi:hypothetical protein
MLFSYRHHRLRERPTRPRLLPAWTGRRLMAHPRRRTSRGSTRAVHSSE